MDKATEDDNTMMALYQALKESTELNKVLLKSFGDLVTEYSQYKAKTATIIKNHLETLSQITKNHE